jgi:predicted MFS family arabinose efflux permease
MDQIGALAGPLIFTAVLYFNGGYREGFGVLVIPALLSLIVLAVARNRVPFPEELEATPEKSTHLVENAERLPKIFWLYSLFIFISVAGFANFQIISYHIKIKSIVSDAQIPIFYAIAMGVDGVAALIVGKAYDRMGLKTLITIPLFTLPIPFFCFSLSYSFVMTGIVLWGIVMGIHETIMRAAIADIIPLARRGTAYGIFNTMYGLAWLIGGTVMGSLYEFSPGIINPFVVIMELVSVPLLFMVNRVSSK